MIGADAFPPTPRQMDVLRFIAGYAEAHRGLMPTFDEIAHGMGFASKRSAKRTVDLLTERGLITRLPFRDRAMTLLVTPPIPRANDGAPLHFIPVDRLRLGHHGSNHNGGIGQDHA